MDRILVDANSIGHAAHQGVILSAGDQETQAVYGFIKAIRAMLVRNPASSILCLWDGLSWRKAKSEVYKANRQDTSDKRDSRERYASQAPFIRSALKHLGVPQLMASNLEADDLAALLVRKAVAQGDFIRLVTGDQDWLQLVGPNCIWEDHRDSSRRVNQDSFGAKTGYPSIAQFIQSKALTGDTSDNLPGVGQIGDKGAKVLLDTWGSVQWFLADPDRAATHLERVGKKLPKAFADFAAMEDRQARFFHNMHMMDLTGDLPAPERMVLSKGEYNPEAFKGICHELGFASIFRPDKFDLWVEPFKNKALN
jgi:5'-3' exonuclease